VGKWCSYLDMTTDWQRLRWLGKRQVAAVLAATVAVLLQGCGGGGKEEKPQELVLDDHIKSYLDQKPTGAVLYMVCIETVDMSIEKIRNHTQHKLDTECHEITDKIENLPVGKHRVEKKCKKIGLNYLTEAVAEAQPPLRQNCTSWGFKQIEEKLANSSDPQLKNILQVAEECFEEFEKDHPQSIQFAQTVFDMKVEKAREDTTALINKLKKAARETMNHHLDEIDNEEKFDLAASTAKDIAVPAVNNGFFRTTAAFVGTAIGLAATTGSVVLLIQRKARSQSHAAPFIGEPDTADESGTEGY